MPSNPDLSPAVVRDEANPPFAGGCFDLARDLGIRVDCCSSCHSEWEGGYGESSERQVNGKVYGLCCGGLRAADDWAASHPATPAVAKAACRCGHTHDQHLLGSGGCSAPVRGGTRACMCHEYRPVSVPEERQEKLPQTEEEWRTYVMMQGEVIKGRYGLGEYAQQPRESVLKSALDALAVAVKGCDAELPDGTLCGEYDATRIALCNSCERQRDAAITALLDGRTTTNV